HPHLQVFRNMVVHAHVWPFTLGFLLATKQAIRWKEITAFWVRALRFRATEGRLHVVSKHVIKGEVWMPKTPRFALAVDDEPTDLEHVRRVLADAGYHVFTASNAKTAMDIFQEHAKNIELLVT